MVAQWIDRDPQVALLAVRGQTAFRPIVASVPLEALARGAGAHDTLADLQEGIDASGPNGGVERAGTAWETVRRASIAAFIP